MPKKEPLYPHVPKSQKKRTSEIPDVVSNATVANIHIHKAKAELELAVKMLEPSGDAQTERVLDLFPKVDDLLDHIMEDLKDISESRPFRHG